MVALLPRPRSPEYQTPGTSPDSLTRPMSVDMSCRDFQESPRNLVRFGTFLIRWSGTFALDVHVVDHVERKEAEKGKTRDGGQSKGGNASIADTAFLQGVSLTR